MLFERSKDLQLLNEQMADSQPSLWNKSISSNYHYQLYLLRSADIVLMLQNMQG